MGSEDMAEKGNRNEDPASDLWLREGLVTGEANGKDISYMNRYDKWKHTWKRHSGSYNEKGSSTST